MSKINFEKLINEYVESNQKEWVHDRSSTVGASEVFSCIRKAFYSKTDAKKNDGHVDNWGAAERGNLIEDHFLVPAFLDHLPQGAEAIGIGDAQETLVDGRLSATPDGLVTGLKRDALKDYGIEDIKSDCIVTEFKSVDPRITLDKEKSVHHGQAQVQMGLIRKLTDFEPYYAAIIYINASFLDDITVFIVEYSPKIYKGAIKRAASVFEEGAEASDFLREGKISGACDYCPFTDLCWEDTVEGHTEDVKSNYEAAVLEVGEGLATKYKEVAALEKSYGDEKKTLAEEIRKFLRDNETSRVDGDYWYVSNSIQSGRQTFDIEAMREDGVDVDRYKKTGNGFEKVTVNVKKAK